jgi:hypothetical protein
MQRAVKNEAWIEEDLRLSFERLAALGCALAFVLAMSAGQPARSQNSMVEGGGGLDAVLAVPIVTEPGEFAAAPLQPGRALRRLHRTALVGCKSLDTNKITYSRRRSITSEAI